MKLWSLGLLMAVNLLTAGNTSAGEKLLDSRLHHLRIEGVREWSDFPEKPQAQKLSLSFRAEQNEQECCLRLRQQDVKQTWKVLLNGTELGRLVADENDTVIYLPVKPRQLRSGQNQLDIVQVGKTPDDIRVGELILEDRPQAQVLSAANMELSVFEVHAKDRRRLVPCRITILNAQGVLASVQARSANGLAVRPGVVYSSDGNARFGLAAGTYTIYAGRGFEYGVDSVRVTVRPGDRLRKTLTLKREVPTEGYVSCDTHIHTLTHSGHGDATLDERMITLAGEGVELPIATDHNCQIDYQTAAVRQGVRQHFTPVIGNEVTTAVGHFNIFPVRAEARIPDFRLKDWKSLFVDIERTKTSVIILNHPRDIHAGFRPFGSERHLALTGENLNGWELKANAMEVVNSGAQQTDAMRLFHDWFGLLNAGKWLTPIGSSDSHDVSRFIVGQGRTYIRCKDNDPGAIDVQDAVAQLLKGNVLVSCGLLAEITVNDRHGPGELVRADGDVKVSVRVLGPSWANADRIELYANGVLVKEAAIKDGANGGVKWSGVWTLPRFRHDVHLVAIASGPGVTSLIWPIAKPYQPTSPVVARRVLGATGAVRLDADGDGKWTCAREYARGLMRESGKEWSKAVQALAKYDEAVSIQVASLLRASGASMQNPDMHTAAKKAGLHVERGFRRFAEAWRESQLARAQ